MTKRPILVLEELLERFFYKEWIQEDLRNIGESTTGSKSELIDRLLHSKWAQRISVMALTEELMQELPAPDLKLVGQFLALELPKKKDQVVPHILKSVDIEPYVVHTRRLCNVCGKNTQHELHFNGAWEANAFKCQTCGTTSEIRTKEELTQPSTQLLAPKTGRVDIKTPLASELEVGPTVAPEAIPSPTVVNIVGIKVERAESTRAPNHVPTMSHSDGVAEIRRDLKELRKSHGTSHVIAVVLGLLAVGLTLFGVGATSSVRYWYLYEGVGISVCLIALAYLMLWAYTREASS